MVNYGNKADNGNGDGVEKQQAGREAIAHLLINGSEALVEDYYRVAEKLRAGEELTRKDIERLHAAAGEMLEWAALTEKLREEEMSR